MIADSPNFIIIISDCTRPDKLSCYGYHRKTTPNIDKIAQEGIIFKNAVTQGVWTLSAHASLFTGLYPSEHDLLSASERLSVQLNPRIDIISEQLKKFDYITAGISNNPWVGGLSGLNRGFDIFMESDGSIKNKLDISIEIPFKISIMNKIQSAIGGFTFKLLIPYLVKRPEFTEFSIELANKIIKYSKSNNKKFFIFINLMDTHQPYFPPIKILKNITENKYNFLSALYHNYVIKKFFEGQKTLNAEEILNNYYDASLQYQDQALKKLFKLLEQKEIIDETMIFFASDHGKNLGEHDIKNKINYLKDNIVKIPLIVRYPTIFPINNISQKNAQLIDINYTIREVMGIPLIHNNDFSLIDVVEGRGRNFSYIEAELPYSPLEKRITKDGKRDYVEAIISGKNKLIKSKNDGFIYSEYGLSIKDEKFIYGKPKKLSKIISILNEQKKILNQSNKTEMEKKLIYNIIRKKIDYKINKRHDEKK